MMIMVTTGRVCNQAALLRRCSVSGYCSPLYAAALHTSLSCMRPLVRLSARAAAVRMTLGLTDTTAAHVRRLRISGVAHASYVSDSGSIDSPMMQAMEEKIKEQLNAESVTVKDAYGDGRHVSIDVVSATFEGQSAVNRQRMVYKAIWEELQSTVHAVDKMTTRTPAEAAGNK